MEFLIHDGQYDLFGASVDTCGEYPLHHTSEGKRLFLQCLIKRLPHLDFFLRKIQFFLLIGSIGLFGLDALLA